MNRQLALLIVLMTGLAHVDFAWAQPFTISPHLLQQQDGLIWMRYPWKYHAGDDSTWADPDLDDSQWSTVRSTLRVETQEAQNWEGIGWFRFHFDLHPSLTNTVLGMAVELFGAAEVYLDGELLHSYGTVSLNPDREVRIADQLVKVLPVHSTRPHVLAVRLSNTQAEHYFRAHSMIGFNLNVGVANEMISTADYNRRFNIIAPMFFIGIFLSLALLHTILFITHPKDNEHLYVAMTSLTVLIITILHHEQAFFLPPDLALWTSPALAAAVLVGGVGGLRLTYAVFSPKLSVIFFVALVAGVGLMLWPFMVGPTIYPAFFIFGLLLYLEHVRVVFYAGYRRKRGSRLLGWGTVAFSLCMIYLLLIELDLMPPTNIAAYLPYAMATVLLCSFSVFLASRQGREIDDLRKQMEKNKHNARLQLEHLRSMRADEMKRMLIETATQRYSHDMDAARGAQRLLLPEAIPEHPDLDIGADMTLAYEGGGNFYDFELDSDGSLTVVMGAAIGNPAKTHTMIAAAKSLFSILNRNADVKRLLELMTFALHKVNFDNMGLSLTLMRFKQNQLHLASAGMPPILIYRMDTQSVEIVDLGGGPLGHEQRATFEPVQLILAPGDTVLLSTHGFMRRNNREGTEMGLDKARRIFEEAAPQSPPDRIIERLTAECDGWADGLPTQDDMSFIVLRKRS